MQSKEIIKQFNGGIKFAHRDGRLILAVAEHHIGPALIMGEDEDTIGVKYEGVDYYSPADKSDDFWDVALADNLRVVK